MSSIYGNDALARAIQKIEALHEGSFQEGVKRTDYDPVKHHSEYVKYPDYAKSYSVCIREVVGDDPIAAILDCLFTAGFCDMHEYADRVLGTIASEDGA